MIPSDQQSKNIPGPFYLGVDIAMILLGVTRGMLTGYLGVCLLAHGWILPVSKAW